MRGNDPQPGAVPDGTGALPGTSEEIDGTMDGTGGTDPEALGHEREQYPDPESYPSPMEGEQEILDGETPDADLQVSDPSGGEARHGRTEA